MTIKKNTQPEYYSLVDIPTEWKICKVKNAFQRKKSKACIEDPIVLSLARSGVKIRDISTNEGQMAESYYEYNPVEPGDLLLNPMDLYSGANCSISKVSGVISQAYFNLKAKEGFNPRYYDFYFKTQYWNKAFFANGKGVSFENRWTLGFETLMSYPIPVPNINEQNIIADYLDNKITLIDDEIGQIRSIIDDYMNLRIAVVSDAVTRGVRESSCKKTGVSWMKEIPDDWKMIRLKYLFEIKKRIAGEEGHTVLSITQQGIRPKDMSAKGQFAMDYSNYQIVNEGDFAMNHMDLITGWVDVSKYKGVTSPDYRVFVAKDNSAINKEYYKYVFQTCYKRRIFYELGRGVAGMGRWRLPANMFLNFVLPVPSLGEQQEIVDYLDKKTKEIDDLINTQKSMIDDLEIYKRSLIYDCVTGKRKVV